MKTIEKLASHFAWKGLHIETKGEAKKIVSNCGADGLPRISKTCS